MRHSNKYYSIETVLCGFVRCFQTAVRRGAAERGCMRHSGVAAGGWGADGRAGAPQPCIVNTPVGKLGVWARGIPCPLTTRRTLFAAQLV